MPVVTAYADTQPATSGSIRDYAWDDSNGDGNTTGELKLSGWTIFLDENKNQQLDDGEMHDVTDQDGYYSFDDLPFDTYTICQVQQDGWQQSFPATQTGCTSPTLTAGSPSRSGKDVSFGNTRTQLRAAVVNYCDPAQRPNGQSIAQWLAANSIDGSDCFEYSVVPSPCGSFDVQFTENQTPYTYEFRYVLGSSMPSLADWEGDGTLPVSFSEDEDDKSVTLTYYAVGPEKDYFAGFDIPNIWDGKGVTVEVNTDCQDPPPVDHCDYQQLRAATGGSGNVAERLQRLGVTGEDCFDITIVNDVCGTLDVIVTDTVRSGQTDYLYAAYHSLTQLKADGRFPLTFPEDYNGGSITVDWTILGTENDYLALWDASGPTVVNTNCKAPEVPVEPTDEACKAPDVRTILFAAAQAGSNLSGCKFNDVNGNGAWDNGEETLSGFTFELYTCSNDATDIDTGDCEDANLISSTVSDTAGVYAFYGLANGTYMVCETPRDGWIQTYPVDQDGKGACWLVPIDDEDCIVNFGNKAEEPGEVLGEPTPEPPVLAETGASALLGVVAGLSIIGFAAGTVALSRKS